MSSRVALFLSLVLSLPLAAADLGIFSSSFVPPVVLDPGQRLTFTITAFSKGGDLVNHATLTVTLPPGAELINVTNGFGPCHQQGNDVVCESPGTFGQFSTPVTFTIAVPSDPAGGLQPITARIAGDTPDADPSNNVFTATITTRHLFVVDTDADDGATSLRGQLNAMQSSLCTPVNPCKIVFARDMVIEPLSPLPQWRACGSTIDGGDKSVEIRGTRVNRGSGMEIVAGCGADFTTTPGQTLRHVAVTNFPENGIAITSLAHEPGRVFSLQHTIESCTITGNHYRGIATNAPDAIVTIFGSTIDGNVASGIAFYSVGAANVLHNQIRGNGASGVFAANGTVNASDDQIAANGQFGISTLPAASILNGGNIIRDNGRQPVDLMMDGPSRAGSLRPPVIIDAFYDPATDRTTIRGHLAGNNDESPQGGTFRVSFAAADRPNQAGFADAQRVLAASTMIVPGRGGDFDKSFEVAMQGDLRGQSIIGWTSYSLFADLLLTTSSEFSDGVVVH